MSKERLEEIKAQYHLLTRNGYDLGAWDEPFSWLIEQAEQVQYWSDMARWQNDEKFKLDQHCFKLEQQNKRYREALEEIMHTETVTTSLVRGQVAYTFSGHIARKALEDF